MTDQPKKRGRPAIPRCPECGRKATEGHYDDCPVGLGVVAEVSTPQPVPENAPQADLRAQEYALRVWHGQSPDALRSWRIERIRLALEGQGLSMEGVSLP